MEDILGGPDEPLEIAREFLEHMRPIVEEVSTFAWNYSDGLWTLTIRAVLKRQFDWLEGSIKMVELGRADMAVALLRPACEEFLWVKYLRPLRKEDRQIILSSKTDLETYDSLKAQLDEVGEKGMIEIGFPKGFLQGYEVEKDKAKSKLKAMGQKLGWTLKKNQSIPSLHFIAKKTSQTNVYKFIYHATSRAVHFSVSELYRRAWGGPSKVVISTAEMNDYWKEFTLCWSLRIFFYTFSEAVEDFEERGISHPNLDGDKFLDLVNRLSKRGLVPIITARELNLHLEDPDKDFTF